MNNFNARKRTVKHNTHGWLVCLWSCYSHVCSQRGNIAPCAKLGSVSQISRKNTIMAATEEWDGIFDVKISCGKINDTKCRMPLYDNEPWFLWIFANMSSCGATFSWCRTSSTCRGVLLFGSSCQTASETWLRSLTNTRAVVEFWQTCTSEVLRFVYFPNLLVIIQLHRTVFFLPHTSRQVPKAYPVNDVFLSLARVWHDVLKSWTATLL